MTTDANVTTWSGRTQEDKNKDIISVKDFGAVGDGVTNDTAAFISLEATFTRRPIDLLGKTYKVNQDFTGHDYYNGILTTGYWEQFEKGTPSSGQTVYFNDVGGGTEYLELDMLPVYVPTDGQGTSTIQGTVFCFKNNVFYTSRVAKKEESVEYMVIEKWGVGDGLKTTPLLTSERTLDIGHQSLGLSYANWYDSEAPVNQKWLWSCAGDSKAPYKARYVSKTDFNETTLSLTTYHYQVMAAGEQINENANRALAISVDGTLLCYTYTSLQNIQRCRVFRVSIFKNALVDYSKQYLYDFPLARESYSPAGTPEVKPIQDIACDGNCIYILQGSTNYSYPTDIKVYKLNGEPVTTDHKCWLGRSSAGSVMSQGGTYYIEPESLFFMPCAGRGISLKALVTIGRSINLEGTTQANGLPYPVPAPHHNVIVDSMPAPSVVLRNLGNLVLTGGQRISHPKAAAFKVGYALPDSTVTDYFKTYYGSTSVYGEILTSELSNQAQLRLTKPNHSIMLQVSGYDNAGVFDTTYNFWVIQSSVNGETHLGNSATGKVYVDADYFMPKKYIGSASERADTIYLKTAPNVLSDSRSKQQVTEIEEAVFKAWAKINYFKYKLNEAVDEHGDQARWHIGLIAQDVISAFESEGLNAFEYGLLCYDEWEAKDAQYDIVINDETGEKETKMISPAIEAGNKYSIRYEEAMALEAAYQRYIIQKLFTQIKN